MIARACLHRERQENCCMTNDFAFARAAAGEFFPLSHAVFLSKDFFWRIVIIEMGRRLCNAADISCRRLTTASILIGMLRGSTVGS